MSPSLPDRPTDLDDRVRCVNCATVYSLPIRAPSDEGPPGCPSCGAVGWLALAFARSPRRRHTASVRR